MFPCTARFLKIKMKYRTTTKSKTIISGIIMCIATAMLLFGCGNKEEEKVVVVDNTTDNTVYGLVSVTKDDVVLSKAINATYMQLKEQTVAFNTGGKRVSKVHVHQGDSVKAGDLLVELSQDNLEEKIDELEYKIEKNRLQLGYLDKAQGFDEEDAYYGFVYNNSDIDEDDVKEYEKNKASIERNYRYKREDYNDEIEFDTKKLNEYKKELSDSRIYSTMSGTVYTVAEGLEGSMSKKDEVVMTIVDNASGRFESKEPDYASYFHEGEPVQLDIVYGSASGSYEVIPYDMASWGDTQQFEVFSGPDNEGIDVGTSATIRVILQKKENVLTLPVGAVYHADGKPYVYMLDENDFRQITWIETGLVGDEKVEITGGLNEGDKVVY